MIDRDLGGTTFHFYTDQRTGNLICRIDDIGAPVTDLAERYRHPVTRTGRFVYLSISALADVEETALVTRHAFENFETYGAKAPPLSVLRDVVIGARAVVVEAVNRADRLAAAARAETARTDALAEMLVEALRQTRSGMQGQVDGLRAKLKAARHRQRSRRGSR